MAALPIPEPIVLTTEEERARQILELVADAPRKAFDAMTEQDKSFVEGSKAFTMIAGAGATGLNMFGVTIAYMSKKAMHGDSNSQTVDGAHRLMLGATFFCFLYTSCSAAVAHATVHRGDLLSLLKVMMYAELVLLSSICGLYYYMLTEDPNVIVWFWPPFLAAVAMTVALNRFLHVPRTSLKRRSLKTR